MCLLLQDAQFLSGPVVFCTRECACVSFPEDALGYFVCETVSVKREQRKERKRTEEVEGAREGEATADRGTGARSQSMCSNHVNASIAMNCTFADRNTSRLNDVHAVVVMGLPLANDHFALFITRKLAPVPCRCMCQHSNTQAIRWRHRQTKTESKRARQEEDGRERGWGRKDERERDLDAVDRMRSSSSIIP
jgi:hypothetical protein